MLSVLLLLALACHWTAAAHSKPASISVLGVSSSRYWFNLRHSNNALAVAAALADPLGYRLRAAQGHNATSNIRQRLLQPGDTLGRTLLYVAENYDCNVRNPHFHQSSHERSCLAEYEGSGVSADSLVASILGRYPRGTGQAHRLKSDPSGSLTLYLTGHGGEGFLKMHDQHELGSPVLAAALSTAVSTGRFRDIHLFLDTCQAASHGDHMETPVPLATQAGLHELGVNVADSRISVTSSAVTGENSYAYTPDQLIGQSTYDGFSYLFVQMIENRVIKSNKTEAPTSFAAHCRANALNTPACRRVLQTNADVDFKLKSEIKLSDLPREITRSRISSTVTSRTFGDNVPIDINDFADTADWRDYARLL